MISIDKLSKSYGGQEILNSSSLTISPGEKIGLVGRNGSGKTTLLNMLISEELPDSGTILFPKNYKVGKLNQNITFTKSTVLNEVTQFLTEDKKYDHYIAEKILFGIGFTENDLKANPLELSGGQQIRIHLASLLIRKPNLLLLDEPTNYLDIIGLRWLKRFLKNYEHEFILITHDREFMDSCTNCILGIHRKKLKKVKGSTKKYFQLIEEENKVYESTRINQEKKIKEIQQFVDRFKAKASKATQAQSRLKALEKIDTLDKQEIEENLDFKFNFKDIESKNFAQFKDISFGYSKDNLLFNDVNFSITKGDKWAIIGQNGKGKSTLLNLMSRKILPINGEIIFHPKIAISHFGQTNIVQLNENITIEEEISSANSELTYSQIRSICGTMMFSSDSAKKKISILSGGEKSRVLLGKILASPTNLLFLDEPTNHLDQESVGALISELNQFQGASVVITHSESFLHQFANKLIYFKYDNAKIFLGSYQEFLDKIGFDDEEENNDKETKSKKKTKKELNLIRNELNKKKSIEIRPIKQQVLEIEKNIEALESEEIQLNQILIEESNMGNGLKIQKLSIKLSDIKNKLEKLFVDYEKHLELLEQKEHELANLAKKLIEE